LKNSLFFLYGDLLKTTKISIEISLFVHFLTAIIL